MFESYTIETILNNSKTPHDPKSMIAYRIREVNALKAEGVFDHESHLTFRTLAGYRNRMVHFYHEIWEHELFDISTGQPSDVSEMANIIKDWTRRHQELMDKRL